jgi:sugar O-acyltransferase (sialic acid O-acetyltransferase NeuD family)
MLPTNIGVIGAGGQAREVAAFAEGRVIDFFAVTADHVGGSGIAIALESVTEQQAATPVLVAVGAPGSRRRLAELWPGAHFATIVSSSSTVGDRVVLGAGTFVAPGAVLTVGIEVGRHAIVNVGATISHDVTLGAFVTVGPGAHVGGHCRVGDGVVIGIGAVVKNGVSIASGSVIGAGAVVIDDVDDENSVVVGNPSRLLRIEEGWADEL